jgi:hypothetical protein
MLVLQRVGIALATILVLALIALTTAVIVGGSRAADNTACSYDGPADNDDSARCRQDRRDDAVFD